MKTLGLGLIRVDSDVNCLNLIGKSVFFLFCLFLFSESAMAAPNLLIDKRVNNTSPAPGEVFRYTIRYRCASLTEDCTGAEIVDAVPADLTIQSYTPASGNISTAVKAANTITWTFNNPLPAGSTGAINVKVSFPACGAVQPSPITNTAIFSASNAANVNGVAPLVTMSGVLAACSPPAPPATTSFKKNADEVRINGSGGMRIIPDNTTVADYVIEDKFPAGLLITKIVGWVRDYEIQCRGSAIWHTVAAGVSIHSATDIAGFAGCVSYPLSSHQANTSYGSELFNITAIRYTQPAGSAAQMAIRYAAMEINPFTAAELPGWTAPVVGSEIQNCVTRSDDVLDIACKNIKVHAPEIYVIGSKALYGSPSTAGFNIPLFYTNPIITEDAATSPPRVKGPSDLVYLVTNAISEKSSYDWKDPVIAELLDPNLTYDPNINWWASTSYNQYNRYIAPASLPYNIPACMNPEFTVTEDYQGTGRTLLLWKFTGCTLYRSLQTNLGLYIVLNTTIKAGTPAGTIIENIAMSVLPSDISPATSEGSYCSKTYLGYWPNSYDVTDFDQDGDTTEMLCKGQKINYTIPVMAEMASSKYVNGKLDSTFDRYPTLGDTDQTGEGTYEMFVENGGNVSVTQLDVVDFLPFVGDTGVLSSNGARESAWEMLLADAITVERYDSTTGLYLPVPTADLFEGEIKYSTSNNPCRYNGPEAFDNLSITGDNPAACTALASESPAGAKSFGFRFIPAVAFAPGEKLKITVNVAISGVPPASSGDIAWNSFAYSGIYQDGGDQPLINSEPIKVGLRMVDTANRAALGDIVWLDTNHNGIQDVGEIGLENVKVNLYAADGTTLVDTASTDNLGFYRFDNLDPATAYVIKLDSPSDYTTGALAGLTITLLNQGTNSTDNDAAHNADGYPEISVTTNAVDGNPTTGAAGTFTDTFDFGLWKPASLGNYVWYDVDAFGDQTVTELPVENMTVKLFDTSNIELASTTTDSTGHYLFDPLPAGSYYLKFDQSTITGNDPITGVAVIPANWTFTALNASASPTDSDANGSGQTVVTVLEVGEYDMSWDAGLKPYVPPADPVSVGNYVWEDLNGNGIQEGGESGIEGVRVDLIEGGFPSNTSYTDSMGYYQFDNIERNTPIKIRVTPPSGTAITQQDQGGDAADSDVDPISGETIEFPLNPSSGTLDDTWDAGIINTKLSLGNQVWKDTNEDGIYSVGEPVLAGLTVNLLGAAVATTTTDANGRYLFTGLDAGDYQVEVAIPTGLSATVATANSTTPNTGTDNDHNGVDTATNVGFARSNIITLEYGGGNLSEYDHGVAINGTTDPTLDRNADYSLDFGFKEKTLSCSITATAVVNTCTNGGGDADTSNDTYTVTLSITEENGSANFNYSSSPAGMGENSIAYTASPYTTPSVVIESTDSPLAITVTDGEDSSCSATITPAIVEPATCSNAANVDLSISKTASVTTAVSGDTVVYNIVVTNNSATNATGVVVNDTLPAEVTYSSDDGGPATTVSGGTVEWAVGNVAAGSNAILNITVTIN